jgi:tryptophanyl-tRNA synthetase
MADKKRVLSCIQPTGDTHLGNYFGAIQNWVAMQENPAFDCVYGVVDYHAMTMPYRPDKLREAAWNMTFQLLACGIDPERTFIQSLVPEHAELAWILGCVTSYGELARMTQFKDKSQQVQEKDKDAFISAGLFYYPILQAADILIYHADYVPVGKDQEQHLELTRNIAERFNRQFGKAYFPVPEPYFTDTPKVLSTADPTRKMSKSLGEKHYINLFGEEERMRKQIRSAVTDTGDTPEGSMSPGVANLFTMMRAAGATDAHDRLMADYHEGTLKYAELKDAVADALAAMMAPIRDRMHEIQSDKRTWKRRIQDSSAAIRERARQTLREVHELTGLGNVR